jgi:integrase
MARKPKRPKTITIGSRVKVRAIRGPHKDHPQRWYWRAERYNPDTRKRGTLWTGWTSRADAEAVVTRIVAETPRDAGRVDVSQIATVRDLLECWLWQIENVGGKKGLLKPSSIRIYTYGARRLLGSLADVRVDRLTDPVVKDYRDARLRADAAPATVASELRVLGHAYRWWAKRSPRPLPAFPTVFVKVVGVRNRYTPSRGEALAVLDHLDGWAYVAGVLLFATGARPGEIRDLTWERIDLARGEAHLVGKTDSLEDPRKVPLGADVVRVLDLWRSERVEASGEMPVGSVLGVTLLSFNSYFGPRLLRRACESAGVPVFTPYGLRRAAIGAMVRSGVDPKTAASITGHSVTVMLKTYFDPTDDDRRAAVMAAGLGSLSAGDVLAFPKRRMG